MSLSRLSDRHHNAFFVCFFRENVKNVPFTVKELVAKRHVLHASEALVSAGLHASVSSGNFSPEAQTFKAYNFFWSIGTQN